MRTLVKAQCGVPAKPRFFFDDFFSRDFDLFPSNFVKTSVAVNVKEDDNQFTLEVAAPGFKKEDFSIEVNDGVLSIAGEVKSEKSEENEKEKFTRKEFSSASFKRSFTVDEESVDAENIAAKYENGILTIDIPKKVKIEVEKKAKTITVA
ncbi:MAG: Hsp20/alpha crystallin family protein [Chitinophagales bacterium]